MIRIPLLAAALLAATLAHAETTADPAADAHADHAMTGTEAPSTMAFMQANATMHAGMDIAFTGDADVDFVRGMIAHHQGAVDMARVVLDHGKDPEVRKLAEGVIAAQVAEIAWMKEWLAKNGQ